MAEKHIEVSGGAIRIKELEIRKKDIADFLQALPEEEHESSFIRALEVGVFCLERARTSQDMEFVRRQVDSLLVQVEQATQSIPGKVEEALIGKVGVEEGQVLAPIKSIVSDTSKALLDRVTEVKELLSEEVDPSKETTTLGKALRTLRDLLDPKRTDSVQGVIESALGRVTTEDGALAKAVKTVVAESVKPLADEVSKLAMEIRGQEAAEEALAQTAAKGATYEDEVLAKLQSWAQVTGAEVHHVGPDNKPGDILVKASTSSMAATSLNVVIEVRDRQSAKGRKAISDDLTEAVIERGARAAIYISRSQEGLAKEIGEWAEGETERGPWVACTDEHLITALRFLMVLDRLRDLRSITPEVDAGSVLAQLQRIRMAIERVKNINRFVSEVQDGSSSIRSEAEGLREDIRDALAAIEDLLRQTSSHKNTSEVA